MPSDGGQIFFRFARWNARAVYWPKAGEPTFDAAGLGQTSLSSTQFRRKGASYPSGIGIAHGLHTNGEFK